MTEFQPVHFGKYTLLERIGVSPTAEVYRASAPDGEGDWQQVSLKKFLPHLTGNQTLLDAFSNTARLARHFEHTNIVRVFDSGTEGNAFFLAGESLKGYLLHDVLASSKACGTPLGLENALYITAEACKGLAYTHGFEDPDGMVSHVIHGNLSPQAIFITSDGQVKLTDFGIQTDAEQDQLAQLEMIKWKLAYMSPEQVGGESVNKQADIFSLGILLYEMVTGHQAFQGQTMDVFSLVRQSRYRPPEDLSKGLPPKVYEIINQCLNKNPFDRYASAGAILEDIQAVQTTLPSRPAAKTLTRLMEKLFAESLTPQTEAGKHPVPSPRKAVSQRPRPNPSHPRVVLKENESKRQVPTDKKVSSDHTEIASPPQKKELASCKKETGKHPAGPVPKRRPWKIPWFVTAPAVLVAILIVSLVFIGKPVLKLVSNSSLHPRIEKAHQALEAKNYKQAMLGFEQVLASNPEIRDNIAQSYAKALEGRATDFLEADPEKAIELLLTARQFDPQSVQICARLGLLYLKVHQYNKAIRIYEKAVLLDPQLAEAFFNLGYVYAVTKDFFKAQEMYRQAVELSPPFMDEALFNLAVVQIQVGNRKESIKNLKRAIKINPENEKAKDYLLSLTS